MQPTKTASVGAAEWAVAIFPASPVNEKHGYNMQLIWCNHGSSRETRFTLKHNFGPADNVGFRGYPHIFCCNVCNGCTTELNSKNWDQQSKLLVFDFSISLEQPLSTMTSTPCILSCLPLSREVQNEAKAHSISLCNNLQLALRPARSNFLLLVEPECISDKSLPRKAS